MFFVILPIHFDSDPYANAPLMIYINEYIPV